MLRSWLESISIKYKVYFLVSIFLFFYCIEIIVVVSALYLTSAVRASVDGENLWSKAQKNALISFMAYVNTHDASNYNDFLKFMQVSLADKEARLELNKLISNHQLVYQKFLEGHNNPDDISRLINLYYYFKDVPYVKDAIDIWTIGDSLIDKMLIKTTLVHNLISDKKPISNEDIDEIQLINNQLTKLEEQFSKNLGQASRWLESLIFNGLIITFILLILVSILMTFFILKSLQRILKKFTFIFNKIINNDFSQRLSISTKDDIELLATNFNQMVNVLEKNKKINDEISWRLKESEERFKQAFEYAAIGIGIVSLDGYWLKVNRSLCNIVDYSEKELLKLTFQDITYSEDLKKDLANVEQLLADKIVSYNMEKRYIRKNGNLIWILLSASLVRDKENNQPLYFLAQIQNIDKQKKAVAKLEQLVHLDSLTNLYNKQFLYTKFTEFQQLADQNNKKIAICYSNLDNFKAVNDKYGHKLGDLALKTVANRLQTKLDSRGFIAHLGAAEFIFIFNQKNQQTNLTQLIDDIKRTLTIPMNFNQDKIQVSANIGISYYPDDGQNLDELIDKASQQLTLQKNKRFLLFKGIFCSYVRNIVAFENS